MNLKNRSTLRTLSLTEKAVRLAFELAPAIHLHWRELDARVGTPEDEQLDFGDASRRIGEVLRSLQGQLMMAAVAAEFSPKLKSPAGSVRQLQRKLNDWLRRLRDLFLLSRLEDAADSVDPRRSYFRPIAGLARARQEPAHLGELLEALAGLGPKELLEARMGMMAIANFPNRPASQGQQRRKKRRRRRSNPGAPSASFRRNRGDDDEYEE